MAFTQHQLDQLVTWAGDTIELARERTAARKTFFGEDDPRPINYWGGAEDAASRRRRFLGYFLFTSRLEDGRAPAEVGVTSLFRGQEREDALRAVRGARYVMASVRSVLPGRAVFLTLEQERFEVPHREWSLRLSPGATVYAHLLPIRRGIWLPGPGWLEMPIRLGPGIQTHLRDLQPDPISTERMLQNRGAEETERRPKPPQDETLEDAVARMTAAAEAAGKERLVLCSAAQAR
jgi:hypothetical protein